MPDRLEPHSFEEHLMLNVGINCVERDLLQCSHQPFENVDWVGWLPRFGHLVASFGGCGLALRERIYIITQRRQLLKKDI